MIPCLVSNGRQRVPGGSLRVACLLGYSSCRFSLVVVGVWVRKAKLYPVVVCCRSYHASSQQLKRLRFIEYRRKERPLLPQGARGTMIAIDERHAAPSWQSHHDS